MVSILPQSLYEDFFVCKLCSCEYREAKTLPCLHSFCISCLQNHVARHSTAKTSLWFMCPECRNIIDIPKNGVESYKTNDFLMNLKQLNWNRPKLTNTPPNSSSSNNASKFALLRQQRGVQNCECSVPFGESKDFYCTVCTTVICEGCREKHRLHSITTLNDKADIERDLMVTLLHKTRKDISVINNCLTGMYLELR